MSAAAMLQDLEGASSQNTPQFTGITERARAREFYRYYHSIQSTSVAQCPTNVEYNAPLPSSDKALTAFAQLGALRLDARRCIISFFDSKYCIVLAEATRTLSLQTGHAPSCEDNLFWGTNTFPKDTRICHYTVNLPMMTEITATGKENDVTALVVNDLSTDERFKYYPFVAGEPHARFYAGVPIRSPNGHNIGAYCVLDDKPRQGICAEELTFMKDMAATVMKHVEMTKITDDHRRGGNMVRSLGCFVEGKSSMAEQGETPWEEGMPGALPENTSRHHRRRGPSKSGSQGSNIGIRNDSIISSDESVQSESYTSANTSAVPSTVVTPASEVVSTEAQAEAVVSATAPAQGNSLQEKILAPDVKTTFGRASKIILEATEVDGAVFFDASVGTFGGLVEEEFAQEQLTDVSKNDKLCGVLGASPETLNEQHSMTEAVLRHFLRRYPRGQIFNFDHDNVNTEPFLTRNESSDTQNTQDLLLRSPSRKPETCTTMLDDEMLFKDVFPEARSVVLFPMWDSHRDRWFAGAVIWSKNPKRVFTTEQELSYLAAFGNSVMVEVARLDAKLADNAKANFISSISHELRSPLHGILNCCDLLKSTKVDAYQIETIDIIDTCGNTLLDTINHVLDFAKINTLNLSRSASKKKRDHHNLSRNGSIGGTNDMMTLVTDVDLCVLTEEVLETVIAGYNYQKNISALADKRLKSITADARAPVSIVVDINKSDNYMFRTQPGAWRRVLMNLFGNALKYTLAGFIKVKLQVTSRENVVDDLPELKLTVMDSGIGMSQEYLRDRLFHSFAQEDPLSQGTGLGLSIVRQIVLSLGGDIQVQSEKGLGTKITVTCPLRQVAPSKEEQLGAIAERTAGLKIAFVGFDEANEYFQTITLKTKTATSFTKKAIEGLCTDWFDMKVVPEHAASPPDLYVATETGAKSLRARFTLAGQETGHAPVIAICQSASLVQSTSTAITVPGHIFEWISQPLGPHKFAKALTHCLDRQAERKNNADTKAHQVAVSEPKLSEKPEAKAEPSPPFISPSVVSPTSETARPPISQSISSPALSLKARSGLPDQPRLSVLAVDDNHINLKLLRTFIDKLRHHQRLATNGLEAVDLYKTTTTPPSRPSTAASSTSTSSLASTSVFPAHFDVVLMDINMPEMDGFEATRLIRAHERELAIKPTYIIALTGEASAAAQQEAFTSGVNLFLIKPVRFKELETVLKGVVTSRVEEKEQEKEKEKEKRLGGEGLDAIDGREDGEGPGPGLGAGEVVLLGGKEQGS